MNGPDEKDQMQFEANDPQMTEFEQALARSMRRVEVRAETTAKFLALADEAERKRMLHPSEQRTSAGDPGHAGGGFRLLKLSNGGRVFAMPRSLAWTRGWMGGAIAAVLAMGIFVGAHVHEQHEQHERRAVAQQQFETAERITDETLARTRAELARQGIELEQ
ncbi:MAG TPA: hypothetical protein VFW30_11090 [Bryocella sp.]|nr:hypothetical protein [Bryocella sp.]